MARKDVDLAVERQVIGILAVITWASSPGPGRPFSMGAEGWLKYVTAQRTPGTSEKYEMILREYWFRPWGDCR